MDGRMDVDAGGMSVGHLQRLGGQGLTEVLLFAWGHDSLPVEEKEKRGAARAGGVKSEGNFPNGDTPKRAANDVCATSQDQVNWRAQGTTHTSATSTHGPNCTISDGEGLR